MCLQDKNKGPANKAGRSQVQSKQKEKVCLAAGSGPAKEVLLKARSDSKELTCSPKYLEGSVPQKNHSRFRKSFQVKIAGSCSSIKGETIDMLVVLLIFPRSLLLATVGCRSPGQVRWAEPAQLFLPGARTDKVGLK